MHTNSGRSLAVRVGALTTALSLMLAGGVAMASSAAAANDNKPDKGNSANSNGNGNNGGQGNTGQGGGGGVGNDNNNGGAIHGDNGPNKNPNNGSELGGNGSDLNGGTGHVAVTICHATRSAQNPYVLVVSDFSSVDEALLWLQGKSQGDKFPDKVTGNGHGDHVGFIWDGQRSGTNWGDIISAVTGKDANGNPMTYYPGYNLDAYSNALESSGRDFLKAGCKTSKPLPDDVTKCVALTGPPLGAYSEQTFEGVAGTDQSGWISAESGKPLSDYTVSADGSACASTQHIDECVALTQDPLGPFSVQTFTGAAGTATSTWLNGSSQPLSAFTVSTNPTVDCGTSYSYKAKASSGIPLCEVAEGKYNQITSVNVTDVPGVSNESQPAADANAQANADQEAINAAAAKATGNNIIKPIKLSSGKEFAGYNWTPETEVVWEQGCSPQQSVIAALPATIAEQPAGGKPNPAKVQTPASATLPGSVPAGDGSSDPALPLWALAMVIVGALGAAAAGSQLLGNRK